MLTLNRRYITGKKVYHERAGRDYNEYADLIVGIVAVVGWMFLVLIHI